ncbi:hypothetical protein SAMN06297358_2050 [Pedobacter xixiisoli]|uniref:Uncharacterized protein n=1 Tax=Pedobacter xixiisoli TaxID=1476464 RepID=A0A285ZZL3_9SPHI|nr:hypothetical protein SAMN06297358_2050 [Pedobacter xixiisoli]
MNVTQKANQGLLMLSNLNQFFKKNITSKYFFSEKIKNKKSL